VRALVDRIAGVAGGSARAMVAPVGRIAVGRRPAILGRIAA
jgi:hypothetical protein